MCGAVVVLSRLDRMHATTSVDMYSGPIGAAVRVERWATVEPGMVAVASDLGEQGVRHRTFQHQYALVRQLRAIGIVV